MKTQNTLLILVILIAVLSGIAAAFGIFYMLGEGQSFWYESIRGLNIEIYGKGLYKHMSAEVAIQGIAQDVVTLFIGIPILTLSFISYYRQSIKGHFILAGVLFYFLVTYLFYLNMAMFNQFFLVYAALLGLTFFAVFISTRQLEKKLKLIYFKQNSPVRFGGGFLVFNAIAISILWLQVVLPPLFDGTVYPEQLHHYTTLIVQGFDLGLLLPISLVLGILMLKKHSLGLIYGTVYLVFLSVLMSALTAKITAMAINGVNVIPVIVIIPGINLITIIISIKIILGINIEYGQTS